jgi:hypothetical protein
MTSSQRGDLLRRLMTLLVVFAVGFSVPWVAASSAQGPAAAQATRAVTAAPICGAGGTRRVRHVIWIWMENHSYSDVIGSHQAPYINGLAHHCLNVTQAHSITHPSGPNYVGATSGIPLAKLPHSDCTGCRQHGQSLFSQHLTWRAYEESMSTNCQLSASRSGLYVPRHNPATYFTVARKRCQAFDVPFSRMAGHLERHGLPQFTFITPDLNHDMHDGSIATGDRWLHRYLPTILNRREYRNGSTLVFVMWDEGNGAGNRRGINCVTSTLQSCHVPLLVLGTRIRGRRYRAKVDHYDVLATTESLLGVPILGAGSPLRLRLR